ncbi:hypothetical protein CsSME_00039973 [Camellia sinensis var. sinensis]
MADTEAKQPTETVRDDEKRLKYLDIIQVATIYVIVCFSSLYEYAKENAGPLKPGVQTVEGIVKTVIESVYDKFHDIPFELLKLIDRKQELSAAQKDPEVTRAVASEVQQTGLFKYEPTAKELSVKYEPMGEQYAVSSWQSINRLPSFPQVAGIVVSTAAYWMDKYNQVVCYTAEKRFTVAAYMPLVPIDRIVKVFEEAEHGPTVSTNGEAVHVTQ